MVAKNMKNLYQEQPKMLAFNLQLCLFTEKMPLSDKDQCNGTEIKIISFFSAKQFIFFSKVNDTKNLKGRCYKMKKNIN
jgi:hypothetical protein